MARFRFRLPRFASGWQLSFRVASAPRLGSRVRRARLVLSAASAVIVLGFSLFAQSYDPVLETGIAPFQTYGGGNSDSVNLATGNLSLHIPLVSFPQRGGVLHANFLLSYNSTTIHTHCPYITACFWQTAGGGYVVGNNDQVGIVPDIGYPVSLPDGTTHIMGLIGTSGTTYVRASYRSVDGSGLVEVVNPSQAGTYGLSLLPPSCG
ncbi:MAG: hypothetical protein DMG96_37710 [Acidobacteria bacterium]|nr:MAG: hypothetical protein DMG96_37710 [Acidobacteriota bacterium]